MRVADLNNSLIESIEEIIYYKYSLIYQTGKPVTYLLNPRVKFDGHVLTIEDDLKETIKVPGNYNISIANNSVFIYSPDKSVELYCMGFSSLSKTMRKDFDKYYSETKFRGELKNPVLEDFDPSVTEILRKFIDLANDMKVINPNNRIIIEDEGLDFLLSISYDGENNTYSMTEENHGFEGSADTMGKLLNLLGTYLEENLDDGSDDIYNGGILDGDDFE